MTAIVCVWPPDRLWIIIYWISPRLKNEKWNTLQALGNVSNLGKHQMTHGNERMGEITINVVRITRAPTICQRLYRQKRYGVVIASSQLFEVNTIISSSHNMHDAQAAAASSKCSVHYTIRCIQQRRRRRPKINFDVREFNYIKILYFTRSRRQASTRSCCFIYSTRLRYISICVSVCACLESVSQFTMQYGLCL